MPEFSPEARTTILYNQNFRRVAQVIKGSEIAVPGTDKRVRITEVAAYPRIDQVGKAPYKGVIEAEQPSEIVVATVQGYPITLVVARDEDQIGACVKLHRGMRINPNGSEQKLTSSQITDSLGLDHNEEPRPLLRYLDDSLRLYVIRGNTDLEFAQKPNPLDLMSMEEQNNLWDRLFPAQ